METPNSGTPIPDMEPGRRPGHIDISHEVLGGSWAIGGQQGLIRAGGGRKHKKEDFLGLRGATRWRSHPLFETGYNFCVGGKNHGRLPK
jgi:hypothetical protein